jgi:hypothetical protein
MCVDFVSAGPRPNSAAKAAEVDNKTQRKAGVEADEKTNDPRATVRAARVTEKEKEDGKVGEGNLPSYALQPRNDTAVGAHCGRVGQGPEMDPRRRGRLVERTAVGEGRVRVGDGSPGSREAEGEGSEGFLYRPKRQARRFVIEEGGGSLA